MEVISATSSTLKTCSYNSARLDWDELPAPQNPSADFCASLSEGDCCLHRQVDDYEVSSNDSGFEEFREKFISQRYACEWHEFSYDDAAKQFDWLCDDTFCADAHCPPWGAMENAYCVGPYPHLDAYSWADYSKMRVADERCEGEFFAEECTPATFEWRCRGQADEWSDEATAEKCDEKYVSHTSPRHELPSARTN